jgi:hypothetical protein
MLLWDVLTSINSLKVMMHILLLMGLPIVMTMALLLRMLLLMLMLSLIMLLFYQVIERIIYSKMI